MAFPTCSFGPQFSRQVAEARADRHRQDRSSFVEAFRCALDDEAHWHVTTNPEDPALGLARAREEQRRLSRAMVDGRLAAG